MAVASTASSLVVLSLGLCILHAVTELPSHVTGSALGFSAELIHRDSPQSPLYDPTSTPFSRFRAAVHRSARRANYFRNVTANSRLLNAVDSKLYSSDVTNFGGIYMMDFYMGGPARHRQKVRAMLDTGNQITWVLCKPCKKCHKHKDPLFDPSPSSTYKKIPCKSHVCSSPGPCGANSPCMFHITYSDGASARGVLSSETLGFDSSDGKISVRVPGILFGCTYHTTGIFSNADIGLVGLNGSKLSLIRQLNSAIGISSQFSYCLPKYDDKSSRIYFGSTADVSGLRAMTTPLFIDDDNSYYLHMEEIVVAGPRSMPMHFAMKQENGARRHYGNTIIDSGTTLAYIMDEIMGKVSQEVERIVPNRRVKVPKHMANALDLCFDWRKPTEEKWMPRFTFYFAGGAELEVTKPFELIEENILCLTITSDRHMNGVSVLGSRAHTGYRTVYDLDAGHLTFLPEDC